MIAMLLVTLFAAAAILAVGAMVLSWCSYGHRFGQLRRELRSAGDALPIRFIWRDTAAPRSAVIYNLDFKARADGLPFHPEPVREFPVAA